jgi:hypothetical protein
MRKFYKRPWFYIPLILLIILGSSAAMMFVPAGQTPALLYVNNGTVEVNHGTGYVTASDGMELSQDDSVRTGEGSATVVLFEGLLMTLKPKTEITISTLSRQAPRVKQSTGKVWSEITKIGGVENYKLQTPTTTATVRGTIFRNDRFDFYQCIVAEGLVDIEGKVPGQDDALFNLTKRQKLYGLNGNYSLQPLTAEDLADIRAELEHEITILRELRMREVLRNKGALWLAKQRYDADEEDIREYLIDIDEGRASEDDIRSQAPVNTPSMQRIYAYNAEIKKTLALLKEYS